MKSKAYTGALVCSMLLSVTAYGEKPLWDNPASGLVFTRTDFKPTDLFFLSETGSQFATARTAAMGGAFSSLGADVSSMHINPAGLGMYQGSDFSVTPVLTIGNTSSRDRAGYISNGSNKKYRFGVGNIGAAFNFYEGNGPLTSFTFGFGVNRMADFNATNDMWLGSGKYSTIARAFQYQLDGYPKYHLDDVAFRNFPYDRWGALMAYDTGLIAEIDGYPGFYGVTDAIGNLTDVVHRAVIKTRGSVMEYNISGGFNFQNKLYFGISLGLVDYTYRQHVYYAEDYENNNSPAVNQTRYLDYDQKVKLSGSGANVKVGFVYRPIDPLRIGFAVHSPTWGNLTNTYWADMYLNHDNTSLSQYSDELIDDFKFSTPTRILGGISYTFWDWGVISTDYERVWYNSMRYRNDDNYKGLFNNQVKNEYKAANIFRIGTEVRPTELFSVRAGFTYGTSPTALDQKEYAYDSPVSRNYYNISGGIGCRLGRYTTFDVAYVFNRTNYADYYVIHNDFEDGTSQDKFHIGNPIQKLKRHTILATLGVRF